MHAVTCENECQNGGVCIVTNMCDCTGTGYTGPTCEAGQLVGGGGGDSILGACLHAEFDSFFGRLSG